MYNNNNNRRKEDRVNSLLKHILLIAKNKIVSKCVSFLQIVQYAILSMCYLGCSSICKICEIIKMPNAVAISVSLHGDNRL